MNLNEKRRQWEQIKEQAPDVADWLTQLTAVFGKPKAVRVKFVSGEVIEVVNSDADHKM